jgi:hypothetical protein
MGQTMPGSDARDDLSLEVLPSGSEGEDKSEDDDAWL